MFKKKKELEEKNNQYDEYYDDYYYDDYYYYYYDDEEYEEDNDADEQDKDQVVQGDEDKADEVENTDAEAVKDSLELNEINSADEKLNIPAEDQREIPTSDQPRKANFVDSVVISQLEQQRLELDQQRQKLEQQQQELTDLRQERDDLQLKFSTVSALPGHYQQLDEDAATMKSDLVAANLEVERLLAELGSQTEQATRAEATVRHYQREMSVKQSEIETLNKTIASFEEELVDSADTLMLQAENNELKTNLLTSQRQEDKLNIEIAGLKSELLNAKQDVSKTEIAEVMIDARAKARQIIEQSKFEASRIVTDAEQELIGVTQDAENLYHKIYATKMDSDNDFEELLTKLSVLAGKNRDKL